MRKDSEDTAGKGDRDVFNEKPTREEQSVAIQHNKKQDIFTRAIIRTTLGDIELELFPKLTAKTVENFTTHAKNGYYDHVRFHRVIPNFMIQTGDPLGTLSLSNQHQHPQCR